MFKPENQYAYIVSDTDSQNSDVTPYINMAKEGYNLAFIYNMTNSQPSAVCPEGVRCVAEELGNILAAGYAKTLNDELPLFNEYSQVD